MREGHRIEAAIRAYQQRPLHKALRELASFAGEPTIEAAVSRAGLAERFNDERLVRYDHQRRIPRHVLEVARERLLAARLQRCASFHELFLAVNANIGEIPGVGELTVYDAALRIGGKLGLEPDRVYLHSGTRIGARRLGLDWRAKWLESRDLPQPLRSLPPWQVEDILCIYKDWFAGDVSSPKRGCT